LSGDEAALAEKGHRVTFSTVFSEIFGGGLPVGGVLVALAVLAAAATMGNSRRWAPSLRRALFFLLLAFLVALCSSLLPSQAREGARPGLLVAGRLLALVSLVEILQFLLLDLALVAWLRRPPPPRILRDFTTLAIALASFVIQLRGTLGVNVTSLLATSAMISVVLGLALQDTLGSFFAGLALQMEAPLAVGEWVRIGESEGRVSQVGWRTVRIVTLDGDEIAFPNSLVTRSALLNYSRPTRQHRGFVSVRVPYRHAPHDVQAALTEAMRGVPGVLEEPRPQALVWEFGESEIGYRARYWIDDYSRVNVVRSDVAARIWYQLRRAGIEHAFPARILKPDTPCPAPEEAGLRTAAALQGVDLFDPLTEEERRGLAARLRPLLFAAGETIIRQGEGGDSLFLITRGGVEVRVASGGAESVVSSLPPGSFFGEMSLLTGDPRAATVVAVEDTEVIPVARADFRHIAAANPAVLEAMTRIVTARRGRLAESIRESEEAAAERAAAHRDLLDRVRAFFGV
jgi:small-conductance mechanosensitive channel/CRP-like cAMP-binding protein